jgi:hypothetical protein
MFGLCSVIAEVRFSAPPDSNRQPDDRQLWLGLPVLGRSEAIGRAGGGTGHLQGGEGSSFASA